MNWASKWKIFLDSINQESFQELIKTGLINTILIAVLGLVIGIVIGTFIAIIKVAPKYNIIVRIANKICKFYFVFFKGTQRVFRQL